MRKILVALLCLTIACAYGDEFVSKKGNSEDNPLRVLSIGNSFSKNAHKFLPDIAKSKGKSLVLNNSYIGGCSLERHMRHAKEHEANSETGNVYPYKKNREDKEIKVSLKFMLTLDKWDIVTIQQASGDSRFPERYEPYGTELIEYIKKYAPQAEIVVHQTWGYREGESRITKWNMTPDEMTKEVSAAYEKFCKAHSLRHIPAGDAFAYARNVELVKEGDKQPSIYSQDGYHASGYGEYLLGCIWYSFLFDDEIDGLEFKPNFMSDENKDILVNIASDYMTK